MLARILIFLGIALVIFLPFNWITYSQLVRIHPRKRRWVIVAVIVGNLMWPLLPLLRLSTPLMRFLRASLGPVWIAWTIFAILYTAMILLTLLVWIPFRKRRKFAQFAWWPSRVFLWFLLIAAIVGYYQAIVPLRIERVPIAVENLPPSLEGKRIALIADLHVGLFTRPSRLETIFKTASDLAPDAVLIAGDLIDDDPVFVPKLLAGTRTLSPKTPLLAVLGNHEMYGNPRSVIDQLRNSRIRLLVNEGYALGDLWIAGISDYAGREPDLRPNLDKALAAKPATSLAMIVAHQPRVVYDAVPRRVPIALTAHTHGTQFGIRPLGWSLAGLFVKYHMGLYHVGPTQLYVNTGAGYWVIPFRLGMTPEITLVELRSVARSRGYAVTR